MPTEKLSLAPDPESSSAGKKANPTETNTQQHPRAKSLSVTVAATLILHMEPTACSNFSDTYPLKFEAGLPI